ncbi:MAG: hypothetical protein LBD43_02375 [Holosporales bacterium]|jgi:hypothetical protein|nr:hypothetical protein [Holosporales bacterium]
MKITISGVAAIIATATATASTYDSVRADLHPIPGDVQGAMNRLQKDPNYWRTKPGGRTQCQIGANGNLVRIDFEHTRGSGPTSSKLVHAREDTREAKIEIALEALRIKIEQARRLPPPASGYDEAFSVLVGGQDTLQQQGRTSRQLLWEVRTQARSARAQTTTDAQVGGMRGRYIVGYEEWKHKQLELNASLNQSLRERRRQEAKMKCETEKIEQLRQQEEEACKEARGEYHKLGIALQKQRERARRAGTEEEHRRETEELEGEIKRRSEAVTQAGQRAQRVRDEMEEAGHKIAEARLKIETAMRLEEQLTEVISRERLDRNKEKIRRVDALIQKMPMRPAGEMGDAELYVETVVAQDEYATLERGEAKAPAERKAAAEKLNQYRAEEDRIKQQLQRMREGGRGRESDGPDGQTQTPPNERVDMQAREHELLCELATLQNQMGITELRQGMIPRDDEQRDRLGIACAAYRDLGDEVVRRERRAVGHGLITTHTLALDIQRANRRWIRRYLRPVQSLGKQVIVDERAKSVYIKLANGAWTRVRTPYEAIVMRIAEEESEVARDQLRAACEKMNQTADPYEIWLITKETKRKIRDAVERAENAIQEEIKDMNQWILQNLPGRAEYGQVTLSGESIDPEVTELTEKQEAARQRFEEDLMRIGQLPVEQREQEIREAVVQLDRGTE